jgi:diguanylate cyclase (GGDEF)-like protein
MDERPQPDTLFRDNWIRFLPALILLVLLSILAGFGIWQMNVAPGAPFYTGWTFWYSLIFSVIFIPLVGVYLLTTLIQTIKLEYAEAALKESNKELAASAEAARRRAHELTFLSELSDKLQAFETIEEAVESIRIVIPKVFNDVSGALYLINAAKDTAEGKAFWGERPPVERFERDLCVALRRSSAYRRDPERESAQCDHVGEPPPHNYVCVPMMAQDQAFGLLCLSGDEISEETYETALTITEQLALALTNIKLRMVLKEQSVTDPLTKLFNRRFMDGLFEREIRRAERGKSEIGIIMMDIDLFKNVNDTYGHAAGDQVLETLGLFLRTSVRMEDYVCRYGGEEFLLVLPGSSKKHTLKRAEDIRERAENLNHVYEDLSIGPITISGGVAAYPTDGTGKNALIEAADASLYAAKENGRNRIMQAKVKSKKDK